jgi:hypothetical protein
MYSVLEGCPDRSGATKKTLTYARSGPNRTPGFREPPLRPRVVDNDGDG